MLSLVISLLLASSFVAMQEMTEQEAIDLATETLARELHFKEGEAGIPKAYPVKWPDSSLGCPEKGTSYLQVIIPGYRVVFRHGDQVYRVHVGSGRAVICQEKQKSPYVPKKERLVAAKGISRQAKQELAERLHIDADDIKINYVRFKTWPDTSLGCPEEGKTYDEVETEGFLVELEHAGKTYLYHTDVERIVLCEKP